MTKARGSLTLFVRIWRVQGKNMGRKLVLLKHFLASCIAQVVGVVLLLSWPASLLGQTGAIRDCEAYPLGTTISSELLVPAMLPPCAPYVTSQGFLFEPIENIRQGLSINSWLTFLALNSPVDGRTPIGRGTGLRGDATTVWETYKQVSDVMLNDGSEPRSWGEPASIPKECESVAGKDRILIQVSEETHIQHFKSGPLIDQNGNYVLFITLMNKTMYDYIRANQLYSRKGQTNFPHGIDFPVGDNGPRGAPASAFSQVVGAIMIRASLKVLAGDDRPDEFHTIDALIYTANDNSRNEATCLPMKLGLVGLHFSHKVADRRQWIWSTFEHVNNVPDDAYARSRRNLLLRYNFYDPTCDASRCPPNQPPPRPWDLRTQPFPNGYKSQITRLLPITNDIVKINILTQSIAGIKGTVWENYMLVGTQWPSDFRCAIQTEQRTPRPPLPATNFTKEPDMTCLPYPSYLANSTFETYIQGETPLVSSSCMGCHVNAVSYQQHSSGIKPHEFLNQSDFTFILEKAH
jgi:hypothetical protein